MKKNYDMLFTLAYEDVGGKTLARTAWHFISDIKKAEEMMKKGELPNSYIIHFENITKKDLIKECKDAEKGLMEDLQSKY